MNLEYQDTITLIETTTSGGYGNESVAEEATVAAIFQQASGWRHGNNADIVTGDATAFVDPSDDFVQAKFNRLEGMLVIADPFGLPAWYRVIAVVVSRDTQLANEINVVQLALKKSAPLVGVS